MLTWTESTNRITDAQVYHSCRLQHNTTNYLRLPWIARPQQTSRIYLDLSLYLIKCSTISKPENANKCQSTFSVLAYDTLHGNTSTTPPWNIKIPGQDGYRVVGTVAPNYFSDQKKDNYQTSYSTSQLEMNTNGIFIALMNEAVCLTILTIRVYYKQCPAVTLGKAALPRQAVGSRMKFSISSTCVANAEPLLESGYPRYVCNKDTGLWKHVMGSCVCSPGYASQGQHLCRACSKGMYKLTKGDVEKCQPCPNNSDSKTTGQAFCPCKEGFSRVKGEHNSSPCTAPPSFVTDIVVTDVSPRDVNISWSAPADLGGRLTSELRYSVVCVKGCNDSGVRYAPSQTDISVNSVAISSLNLSIDYEFLIVSRNLLGWRSTSEGHPAGQRVTVAGKEPVNMDAVTNFEVYSITDNSVELKWKSPVNKYVNSYEIVYYEDETQLVTTFTKLHHILITGLDYDTVYHFKIRPRYPFDTETESPFTHIRSIKTLDYVPSSTTSDVYKDSKPTIPLEYQRGSANTAVIAGAVVAVVICAGLLLAVVILCVKRKKRYRTREKDCNDGDQYSNVNCARFMDGTPLNNSLDVPLCNTSTLKGGGLYLRGERKQEFKTYIDPHTYEDVNKAVSEFTKEICLSRIEIEALIGIGEFGQVYKGYLTRPAGSKSIVAIKTLKDTTNKRSKLEFLTEASCMGQFDHENVIFLEGVVLKSNPVMIITEFMENGSLDKYLRNHDDKSISSLNLVEMLRGISDGMKYLADMCYVHRDLAARNILVNKNLTCKVSDFGLSRECSEGSYTTKGGKIPVRWTAPEAIAYRKFTSSSDCWSFGIVMWEVMTFGERPYWDWSNQVVINEIDKGYRLTPPMDCPEIIYNIMLHCWNKERQSRPKFSELYQQLDSICRDPSILDKIATIISPQKYLNPSTKISEWLTSIDLQHYDHHFLQAGYVNIGQLKKLDSKRLAELGISLLGDRKRLLMSLERVFVLAVSHRHEDSGAGSTLSSRECSPTRDHQQPDHAEQQRPVHFNNGFLV